MNPQPVHEYYVPAVEATARVLAVYGGEVVWEVERHGEILGTSTASTTEFQRRADASVTDWGAVFTQQNNKL